tara:strand:- start:45 stop:1271 length:1227 start_codon:yes stop_codon:yes gene_type:complete
MLKSYDISELKQKLTSRNQKLVLFGAGDVGELANYSFNKLGVTVDFYCDNDKDKQGQKWCGIDVLSVEDLIKLEKETYIFISNNYSLTINKTLKQHGFLNVYNCVELFKKTDFSNEKFKYVHPLKLERRIEVYNNYCFKDEYAASGILNIKSLDVQITERCSLKCTNCSNLMQYYERPVNEDNEIMFSALDRFIDCIDKIYEFRVLGGDPFMNKEMYKVINKLVTYQKVEKVIIYTNGKIVPKGPNLECLKNKKVILDITNYGSLSIKHDEIVKVCEENNILYSATFPKFWQDCGRVLPFQKRTEEEKKRKFSDCCNSDILSLLKGKIYRCPFSANAENLNAIPLNKEDHIDLNDLKISKQELKNKIKDLVYNKEYITACSYCNGRDYTVGKIKAGEQTKKPLEYSRV